MSGDIPHLGPETSQEIVAKLHERKDKYFDKYILTVWIKFYFKILVTSSKDYVFTITYFQKLTPSKQNHHL